MRREFSKDVREQALGRAQWRCQECGSKKDLELHHVGNPMDNSLFNCEVLCSQCHGTEHKRRDKRFSMKPIIIGMHNVKSDDPADAMEPFTANGAGERLWRMVSDVCCCTKDDYARRFELMNVLNQKEWAAADAKIAAGMIRFKLSGRCCFVLGKEAWAALGLPGNVGWFKTERSYTGAKYTLLPHPSGKNLMYNDAKIRLKAGTMLTKAGGWS